MKNVFPLLSTVCFRAIDILAAFAAGLILPGSIIIYYSK
jgi:hypothetical protein